SPDAVNGAVGLLGNGKASSASATAISASSAAAVRPGANSWSAIQRSQVSTAFMCFGATGRGASDRSIHGGAKRLSDGARYREGALRCIDCLTSRLDCQQHPGAFASVRVNSLPGETCFRP